MSACIMTAQAEGLFGVLHTTWHTLSAGMPYVLQAAVESFEGVAARGDRQFYRTQAARVLRRVQPALGEYRRAGWAKKQVGEIR